MKEKIKEFLILILTASFVLGFAVWRICKPDDTESLSERRKLTQAPALTMQNVLSGRFMTDFESYTLDQFPLRSEFRTVKALFAEDILCQSDNNGLYRVGDHLAKLEYPMNTASLDHAAERFRYLYEAYLKDAGSRVYLSLIPDKNYFMAAPNGYPSIDYEQFAEELQSRTGYM